MSDEENRSAPNPEWTTPAPGLVVGAYMRRNSAGDLETGYYVSDPEAPNGVKEVPT